MKGCGMDSSSCRKNKSQSIINFMAALLQTARNIAGYWFMYTAPHAFIYFLFKKLFSEMVADTTLQVYRTFYFKNF